MKIEIIKMIPSSNFGVKLDEELLGLVGPTGFRSEELKKNIHKLNLSGSEFTAVSKAIREQVKLSRNA